MSNPYYYRSPVDDLIASPLIRGADELMANDLAKSIDGKQSDNASVSFADVLADKQREFGCHDLMPIDCSQSADEIAQNGKQNIQQQVQNSLDNILNASKPGYHKKFNYFDKNGNLIEDQSNGPLQKTQWQFDLGIEGDGKGFKLANGQYTRDGRFRFDGQGKPVSVKYNIPLSICYKDGAPVDWSLKQVEIDTVGQVTDSLNGQVLGTIELDLSEGSKIRQGYLERSNVNLPIEFMGLQQKLRLVDLNNNVLSAGAKLDNEAVQILRGL